MIPKLPKSLVVGGIEYDINSHFVTGFNIMQMLERNDISESEKIVAMIGILYNGNIPIQDSEEAAEKAVWFLDGGNTTRQSNGADYGKLYSWEKDAQFILSAVNLTLGISCRSIEYLHWWDFTAALMECKECTFSTLVHQRKLREQGKQNKWDKEWWAENKEIAEIKIEASLTAEEQDALDKFNKLLG